MLPLPVVLLANQPLPTESLYTALATGGINVVICFLIVSLHREALSVFRQELRLERRQTRSLWRQTFRELLRRMPPPATSPVAVASVQAAGDVVGEVPNESPGHGGV